MHDGAAMRVVLVALLAWTATARADDGFDWDPPPPSHWRFQGVSVIQGKPNMAPWVGFGVGVDHRLDSRVSAGFLIASMLSRELREDPEMELGPLQTATFAAATARIQLGETEVEDASGSSAWFAWEMRAELGTAFITKQRMRSMPAIGAVGLTGLVGGRRTRGLLSIGYAFTFAGQPAIEPGGIDIRMGVTRSW